MTKPGREILVSVFLAVFLGGGPSAAFNPPPGSFSSGEVSPVQSCFYECKQARTGTVGTIFEDTLLMLVNESPLEELNADVLLMDGREKPVAHFRTHLSPEDLDEINICRTFERAGILPPQAGVIEIVTTDMNGTPEGGVYAWIKDVIGRKLDTYAMPVAPVTSILRSDAIDVLVDVAVAPDLVIKKIFRDIVGIGKTGCRVTPPEVFGGAEGLGAIATKSLAARRVFPIFEEDTDEYPMIPGGVCNTTQVLCRQAGDQYDVPCVAPDTCQAR